MIFTVDFLPVPQPPPQRHMTTVQAAANESNEDRQFRKVFQQLAGDVSTSCLCLEIRICLQACIDNFINLYAPISLPGHVSCMCEHALKPHRDNLAAHFHACKGKTHCMQNKNRQLASLDMFN